MDFLVAVVHLLDSDDASLEASPLMQNLNDKEKSMIRMVRDGDSEVKIARVLLGQAVTGTTYKDLRRSLARKCQDHILGSEMQGTAFTKRQAELSKLRATLELINLQDSRATGLPIAKELITKAARYQQHKIAHQAAVWLMRHYSIYAFDNRKSEKYRKLVDVYNDLVSLEDFCDIQFAAVYRAMHLDQHNRTERIAYIKSLADLLESKVDHNSYKAYVNYYMIRSAQLEQSSDYPALVKLLQESVQRFQDLPFSHPKLVKIFTNKLIRAHVSNRDLAKADLLLDLIISTTKRYEMTYTYASLQQTRIRLLLNRPADARQSLQLLPSTKLRQYEDLRRTVVLYQFYTDILLGNTASIKLKSIKTHLNPYRKYKTERYVGLLVGELLYYITSGKYDKLIDKAEALYMYTRNHLQDNSRAAYFIKNLVSICRGNTATLDLPYELMPDDEMEVVPFEQLQVLAQRHVSAILLA